MKKRPSSATVIACLALFFAIAGGSAIALQGRNSVDSGDIKPKAVKTSDIANNAVTTRKIRNNHVRAADIQAGAVQESEVANAEAFHIVGAAGEPVFSNGGQGDCLWSTLPGLAPTLPLNPVSFYRDPYGVVHLRGVVRRQDGPGGDGACDGDDVPDVAAFTLPPGYRPVEMQLFAAVGTGDPGDLVLVAGSADRNLGIQELPAGSVLISGPPPGDTSAVLDGIAFRAAGTGEAAARRDDQGLEPGESPGVGLDNLLP